jgi:hypothetical protein
MSKQAQVVNNDWQQKRTLGRLTASSFDRYLGFLRSKPKKLKSTISTTVCEFCGLSLRAGQMIVATPVHKDPKYAHEYCYQREVERTR